MPSTATNGKEFVPMIVQNASVAKFLVAMHPSVGKSTAAPKSMFVMDARSPKWRTPSPRAQLQQDEAEGVRKFCLKCCRGQTHHLQCSQCQTTPALHGRFRPNMATMPAAWIACEKCQSEAQQKVNKNRRYSAGWFECRGCGQMFPIPRSSKTADKQSRRCLNCTTRGTRKDDEQTCRGCKRKWSEVQTQGWQRPQALLSGPAEGDTVEMVAKKRHRRLQLRMALDV